MSQIQPLANVIITNLKAQYQRGLLFRVYDNIDAEARTVHNIDIITFMNWVQEAWNDLMFGTVLNS